MLKYHIQTVQLSAAQKAIVFTSIPSGYDDLLVTYSVRSDRAGNIDDPVNFTLNGASTGYSSRSLVGPGSGSGYTEVYGSNTIFAGYMPAAATTANTFGSGSFYVPNYTSSSTKSTSIDFVSENNGTTAYQSITTGSWSGTSAVHTVAVSAQVSNLVQHSSASLYGIKRGSDGRTEVASGGTVTTSGGFTIHTFTGSGTFVANRDLNVEVLVVAGGGGGGQHPTGAGAGGGGAGGYLSFVNGEMSGGGVASTGPLSLSAATSYPITVGAGGAAGNSSNGANGTSSAFSSFVAVGGGGGGRGNGSGDSAGNLGGSGGGSGSASGSRTPGVGTAEQGFAGGVGAQQPANYGGGGGGGAGAVGGNALVTGGNATGGNGGAGVSSFITGSSVTRGGGGGGSVNGLGGTGGGGTAGNGNGTGQTAGTANTGGGGGAGYGSGISAAGGSGIVIIRYMTPA